MHLPTRAFGWDIIRDLDVEILVCPGLFVPTSVVFGLFSRRLGGAYFSGEVPRLVYAA